jgi:hypothetical protein
MPYWQCVPAIICIVQLKYLMYKWLGVKHETRVHHLLHGEWIVRHGRYIQITVKSLCAPPTPPPAPTTQLNPPNTCRFVCLFVPISSSNCLFWLTSLVFFLNPRNKFWARHGKEALEVSSEQKYAPHNDVSVDGPPIWRWSHKIIIQNAFCKIHR